MSCTLDQEEEEEEEEVPHNHLLRVVADVPPNECGEGLAVPS
jgi:hypothetical protein